MSLGLSAVSGWLLWLAGARGAERWAGENQTHLSSVYGVPGSEVKVGTCRRLPNSTVSIDLELGPCFVSESVADCCPRTLCVLELSSKVPIMKSQTQLLFFPRLYDLRRGQSRLLVLHWTSVESPPFTGMRQPEPALAYITYVDNP